jgi:hypothetical protein
MNSAKTQNVVNIQKSIAFRYTANKNLERNYENNYIYNSI